MDDAQFFKAVDDAQFFEEYCRLRFVEKVKLSKIWSQLGRERCRAVDEDAAQEWAKEYRRRERNSRNPASGVKAVKRVAKRSEDEVRATLEKRYLTMTVTALQQCVISGELSMRDLEEAAGNGHFASQVALREMDDLRISEVDKDGKRVIVNPTLLNKWKDRIEGPVVERKDITSQGEVVKFIAGLTEDEI